MCASHSAAIIQMFQTPTLIVMSIAATRMHRSLTDFAAVRTERWDIFASSALPVGDNLLNSYNNVTRLNGNQAPFNKIQVTVDTSSDACQLSRTSQHDLCNRTEQPSEKPNGDEPLSRAVEAV